MFVLKTIKFDDMKKVLREIQWNEILVNDVDTDWDCFKKTITAMCDQFIPKKTIKEIKQPPWLKREIVRLLRQKRAAWRRYQNSKLEADLQSFKLVQKKVKNSIKRAKHNHEIQISKNAKKNPKLFYSYLSNKKQNRIHVGPLNQGDGGLCDDSQEMAEMFNRHYAKVFTEEDANLPPNPPPIDCPEMSDIHFSPYMVTEVLKKLKNSSSPGPDEISQRVLKETADEISLPLSILFEKSMQSGVVPMDWRTANVVPIYKSGPKGEPVNYRPISLTSVVVRVMERILKIKMLLHLKENRLINPSQHGFLPKKSTSTNLNAYLEYMTKKLDEGQAVDVLYLDFSKAFDKVPHKRLIQKLKAHNFSKSLITWITAWLNGRKQRVLVNGTYSEWLNVVSSVVQGSVLGPILFVVYINDIDTCIGTKEGIMSKFADDTKVAKVVKDTKTAAEMQEVMQNLETWCEKWGMVFNIKKCCILHFGHRNMQQQYKMSGQILESHTSQRDLGVMISNDCLPGAQCALAAKKANQVLGQVSRSFSCKNKDVMLQIYKVFIRPHLEYAVTSWSPWQRKDVETLEKIQHRATRGMSDRARQSRQSCNPGL